MTENNIQAYVEKLVETIKESLTRTEMRLYDYIEYWEDEGTYRYITDTENTNGEVEDNVVGLISTDVDKVIAFGNDVQAIMKKEYASLLSLEYNKEIIVHNC